MIRAARAEDYAKIMQIWLNESLRAHHFIAADYWHKMYPTVEKYYLPNTETYVLVDKHKIKGFISILEGSYIGALFVDGASQKQGIGSKLLAYTRRRRAAMSLKVYVKNTPALRFYQKNGFKIVSEQIDITTNEPELLMSWGMGCKSGLSKRRPEDS